MFRSFEEKRHVTNKKGKRNDVRKPNIDTNRFGGEIKKPIHLATKKKELLEEKRNLLKGKKNKTL